jgi:uncharacterized membrane protein required for colicin V production
MVIIDIILLLVLFGFALFGLWFGLIHTLGALVGTILGAYLSSRLYDDMAVWVQNHFSGSLNIWKVVSFILLFTIINRLVGLVFYLVEKVFNVISIIPFLKTINRLAGALLGALEGSVVIGAFIFISHRFPFGLEEKLFAVSQFKNFFLGIFNLLMPFIPPALKIVG